ncbi:MAG TPA: response regulator, partial [Phenylobacterium sp.]|nr:response regulator [Phenylobacterium sp.]
PKGAGVLRPLASLPSAPTIPAQPIPAEEAEVADLDGRALRLLAAEDNPTNQQVLAAVMASLSIEVEIVGDGAAAVEAWTQWDFDLVLMDIQMPVMDGIAASREIRRREAEAGRSRTPIIALTANALAHQVDEYLAAGMDGHVAKPIEIAKLYETIGQVIARAEADQAAVA